ncbi:MAG: hypothetical protein J6L86_01240 [Alphaproteobacteria bacterium]|nr:hypothetical protein [Alphaproteobacteria bacterium]
MKDILVSKGCKEDVWKKPWCDELMEKIETNGDIEEVINAKNQKLYEEFVAEEIVPREGSKVKYQEEISQLEEKSSRAGIFNQKLDDFEKDVEILVSKYPSERQLYVKSLLQDYFKTGEFVDQNDDWVFQQLKQPPKGFFNKIRQGTKIKDANRYLDAFIDKYQTVNLRTELNEISETFSFEDYSTLKSKFESIAERDKENTVLMSEKFAEQERVWQRQISEKQQRIQSTEAEIKKYKTSFKESKYLQEEDEVIRNFAKEIRDDIQNPKQYKVSDYIECLENMSDNEKVMFNLRLAGGNEIKNAIDRILKYNGLQTGNDMKQWLIRKEMRNTSDNGMHELFSPVMTVKEAKEIMPKLKADFEYANVSSGVVVPLIPENMFKDVVKQTVAQDIVDDNLHKLMVMAKWQVDRKNSNVFYTEEREKALMQYLGVSSLDELPPVYGSMDELKQQFPKDKYLFSGTMASDDYCQFSGRIGRNGMVYATPDIEYAAKYDGATNLGNVMGTSATGDKYISTEVGQVNEKKVYVGFINVYEQSSEDKFFDNFGMEDYRRSKEDMKIGQGKSFELWEPSPQGAVILNRQGQVPVNHRLTKEQAINGFVNRSQEHEINGKVYMQPRYDAETYVTPKKNPLKAKVMHIYYKSSYGAEKNLYIPIPDNPNEFIKYLLNSRQADMTDTFKAIAREDVLARFQKQKEEFKAGIIHQARTPDFWKKKQAKLQSGGQEREEKSGAQAVAEAGEKTVEKTVAHAGTKAVKSSEGIVSAIAKADNAVNQAIDKTIDKGSELLNNNAVGRAYEKAAEKVADTKVVKAVEKTTAKAVEKAANTAVGKAVVKTAAKAAGSAVGKSVIKKIPLVSVAAGCYFAWDRIKDRDWKGACGEVASGVAGCFPGLGTAASAAIDVGLAAKDIKAAVDESKQPVAEAAPNTGEKKTVSVEQTEDDKKKMRDIILQKQGRISSEVQAQVQQPVQQNNNYAMHQKMVQQGRG